jgi:hypothetical protein
MKLARLRLFLILVPLGGLLLGSWEAGQAAQTTSQVRAYLPLVYNPAYTHGTVGFDYSFPGCSTPVAPTRSSLGTPYSFAVVGVNGGKPFTQNSCLASEFQSAAVTVPLVSFYINISAPIGSTAGNGMNGPKGQCSSTDYMCQSYNFGYNAAQDAYSRAATTLGTSTVAGRVWWLDVETANSWWGLDNGNCTLTCNDQVLQGAIDYFHQGGMTVGAYSISSMWALAQAMHTAVAMSGVASAIRLWTQIAGGGYQPGVPAWTSGASSLSTAPTFCSSTSFTGGPVWLVQRPLNNYYDEDYAC